MKFGNAWRVKGANSLFDYAPGVTTKTFTLASWPSADPAQPCTLPTQTGMTNKPPLTALSLEEAERCCAGIVDKDRKANCVKDVRATGECGFAKTYLFADQIDRNRMPTAPVLVFPEDFKTNLARTVTFTWNHSSDADGDPIKYRHYVWPVDQAPNSNDAKPVRLVDSVRGNSSPLAGVLLGCLAFASIRLAPAKRRSALFLLFAVIVLAGGTFACKSPGKAKARNQLVSETVTRLEPGKAYFWKVIAEDGKGGTTESETRRFEVNK